MPTDTKRVPGPESSQPYQLFEEEVNTEASHLFTNEIKRDDGRGLKELRPLIIKTNVITQAKGSAYVEMNNTKVMAAVYGPREIPKRSDFSLNGILNCSFNIAPFACVKRRSRMDDSECKEYALLVKEALEPAVCLHQFQKSQVDVHVTVLENDGSVLAASIMCASVALSDASIPMYDILIGASMSQWSNNILLDPTAKEEFNPATSSHVKGNMTVAYMPSLEQVATFFQEGSLDLQSISSGLEILVETCQHLQPLVQNCLVDALKKRMDAL